CRQSLDFPPIPRRALSGHGTPASQVRTAARDAVPVCGSTRRALEDHAPPCVVEDDAKLRQHARSDPPAGLAAAAAAGDVRALDGEATQPEGTRACDVATRRGAKADAGLRLP